MAISARLNDRVEYGIYIAACAFLGALPRALALRVGANLGTLLGIVLRPQRRIALHNLAIAFPEKSAQEHRAILRRTFRNLGRSAAEFVHLPSLTAANLERYVRIEDPERWRTGVSIRPRGVIILSGHFGSWELLAYAQGLLGHPVTLVHRPMRNRLVDAAIMRVRERAGTRSISKKSAARSAIRALHRGELVVIPADQNQPRRDGVFADLFGLPASTTPGPARLAALTGAPIVPVFIVREGGSERHCLRILPAVEPVDSGNPEADVIATTRRCNAVFETMLREHPDHWIWFHKRWRTRPLGEPRIYER